MAKRRRANGEGTVGRTADGRWYATRQITLPDGRTRRVKREGKTRALAVGRLQEAVTKLLSGVTAGKVPTLAAQVEHWYADTFCAGAPRPSSKRARRSLIDHQIAPYIGSVRIDQLRGPQIRAWLADLVRDGYAARTIGEARAIVRMALDQAVDDALISHNPITRKLRGPRAPGSPGVALTVEQARALLAAARGARLEAAIRLALGLGLRRGEVCGLRWQDVDLDAGRLTVAGQLTYDPATGLEWAAPKTEGARRVLRLPAALAGVLRWHQTRQQGERAAAGWPLSPYVFTNVTTGGPLRPTSLYRAFKEVAVAAGLEELRFHDLRHSAASFLLAEGVPVKSVAAILGHARTSTTLDIYGHLLPGEQEDATERVSRRLDSPPADDATDNSHELGA